MRFQTPHPVYRAHAEPLSRADREAALLCGRGSPHALGTGLDLQMNVHGQVLDGARQPNSGLYAWAYDMHCVMGGEYPGLGLKWDSP